MIKKDELIRAHKNNGLPLATVEKDYVLSLLLWAISQNKELQKAWVFKGGTCLKKCYFGDYRFSEDLDYTVMPEAPLDVPYIRRLLGSCFENLYETFALQIKAQDVEISPFPDKNDAVIQIKIPFHGPLMPSGSWPRIKLDLSQEEQIVDAPVFLPLIHQYSDASECEALVKCYSLCEIFAEKLRALIQRTRPRDLYDVVHLAYLCESQNFNWGQLDEVAEEKFKAKELLYPDSLLSISPQAIKEAEGDWGEMLSHQVNDLKGIETFINQFESFLEKRFGKKAA